MLQFDQIAILLGIFMQNKLYMYAKYLGIPKIE